MRSMGSIRILWLSACIGAAGPALAEYPFGEPRARRGGSDEVSPEQAQKIALRKARSVWGQVATGPVLPCVDEDGDVVAYMFPFAIGAASFPSYAELARGVRRGRHLAEAGYDAMTDGEKVELEGRLRRLHRPVPLLEATGTVPVDGLGPATDPDGLQAAARRHGREGMIGSGRFGTVVVSARRDRFPIPLYTDHLPPYFYQGDLAAERASAAAAAPVTLERVYFLEHHRAQYFEYSAPGGSVLVHAHNLEVEAPERVLARRGRKALPEPEAQARIAGEWAKATAHLE